MSMHGDKITSSNYEHKKTNELLVAFKIEEEWPFISFTLDDSIPLF